VYPSEHAGGDVGAEVGAAVVVVVVVVGAAVVVVVVVVVAVVEAVCKTVADFNLLLSVARAATENSYEVNGVGKLLNNTLRVPF
jgi:hypothetical protein